MNEAKSLGELIKEFSQQENVSDKLRAYQVVGEWERIVGVAIARNTEISRVETGPFTSGLRPAPGVMNSFS